MRDGRCSGPVTKLRSSWIFVDYISRVQPNCSSLAATWPAGGCEITKALQQWKSFCMYCMFVRLSCILDSTTTTTTTEVFCHVTLLQVRRECAALKKNSDPRGCSNLVDPLCVRVCVSSLVQFLKCVQSQSVAANTVIAMLFNTRYKALFFSIFNFFSITF